MLECTDPGCTHDHRIWECTHPGCTRGPKTGDVLYRTSPKGTLFAGTCSDHHPDRDAIGGDANARRALAEAEHGSTTHRCPPRGSGLTPCCNQSPVLLPAHDRLTLHDVLVTCRGGGEAPE